jgi:son of sevenless
MASLENCEKLFDPSRNFYVYRHELLSVQSPCVPFLGKFKGLKQIVGVITGIVGVYLTDLVYINEGRKDFISPKVDKDKPLPPPTGPLINFAKRQKAAETIREIKSWQANPYNLIKVAPVQTFLEETLSTCTNVAEMSELFWLRSLDLEPREGDEERMNRLLQESGFL